MASEVVLWTAERSGTHIECTVGRDCAGVQLRLTDAGRVLRREQHADSSTAYERARDLRAEFERDGFCVQP